MEFRPAVPNAISRSPAPRLRGIDLTTVLSSQLRANGLQSTASEGRAVCCPTSQASSIRFASIQILSPRHSLSGRRSFLAMG